MDNKPDSFSVVIPTFNRPRQLAACLQSLAWLDYPRDCFDVIVVDDGSPSSPEAIVNDVRADITVTLLRQPNGGPAAARNTGATQAEGKFLAFTDDDCAPDKDWLRTLAARFAAETEPVIVGGRTVNALPNDVCATASQVLIDYLYSYYNARPSHAQFLASNNMALPTRLFQEMGGFNTTYTRAAAEDRELCDRWLSQGRRMVYAPEVVIFHAHAMSIRDFWRQHFCYGRGAFRFHQARAQFGRRPIRLEPLAFYHNLLRHPFIDRNARALLIATLLGLTQVAHAAGFVAEKARIHR